MLYYRGGASSRVFLTNGGNMNTTNNTYATYTGTFVKQNGQARTMTFIKSSDIPSNVTSGQTRNLREGQEVVFDIERGGFRIFNWNTVKGIIAEGSTNYNFVTTNGQ